MIEKTHSELIEAMATHLTDLALGNCPVCHQPIMMIAEDSDTYETQCGCGSKVVEREEPAEPPTSSE